MRDLHRVKFTGKGGHRKIRYLLHSYVCEHYISREDSLSSVMVLFIPRKLRSVTQVDTVYVSKVTRATHIPG